MTTQCEYICVSQIISGQKNSHQLINNGNPQLFDHNSYTKSSELTHFVTTTHLTEKSAHPHLPSHQMV